MWRLYAAGGVGVGFIAGILALTVVRGQLADARDEIATLEGRVATLTATETRLRATLAECRNRANEQSVRVAALADRTGSDLFARGRQIGRAECLAAR